MYTKIENNTQFQKIKEKINAVCSKEDKDKIIEFLEKEYKLKDYNEILYIFIRDRYKEEFYYKIGWKKIKTVFKETKQSEYFGTGIYCIILDEKYEEYNFSFIEAKK